LAVPGAIVGAVVGAVASTHTPFLADVGLALWALVGAIIAVAGGGLIAGAVLRLGMLVRAPRRIKEPLSIVGWLVGSLVTAVLFGSILWTLMGW
jgi:hypothetical protein